MTTHCWDVCCASGVLTSPQTTELRPELLTHARCGKLVAWVDTAEGQAVV